MELVSKSPASVAEEDIDGARSLLTLFTPCSGEIGFSTSMGAPVPSSEAVDGLNKLDGGGDAAIMTGLSASTMIGFGFCSNRSRALSNTRFSCLMRSK